MERSQYDEDEEMQTMIAYGESQAGQSGSQQDEIVQKIQQLINQEKAVAITDVVNLTVTSLRQQKQIALLKEKLKQVFKDNQMMTKIQNIEEECRSDVNKIEEQRNSLASKLNDEYREISDQLQLFDKIRSQLKIDVGAGRVATDILIKRLNEMKEIAHKHAVEYDSLMTRYKTCKSELTGRLEQLKGQHDALHACFNEATAKYEIMKKEREAKVMELSEKITEMERDFCNLQSAADQSTKQYEHFKLSSEQEFANLQQEMDSFEKDMKKQHDEQFLAYDKKKCQLKEETDTLENEIRIRSEKVRDLTEANERFRGLQEQRKQKCEQSVPKRATIGSGGNHKRGTITGTAKMQSSVNPETSCDLDCLESYHYDNEMSLMSIASSSMFQQHFKKHKK